MFVWSINFEIVKNFSVAALYIISEILTTPNALEDFDWYILPIMNPDGLVFSQKEVVSAFFNQ